MGELARAPKRDLFGSVFACLGIPRNLILNRSGRGVALYPAKKIVIIAGPNGAGKTTFALEFLPREAGSWPY